jgi:molybdopterin-guanine dinucleotide biosynthesis protein A
VSREIPRSGAVAAYVLAGGASSRFGSDKALAKIGDQTVLSRVCRLVGDAAGEVRVVAPAGRYPEFAAKLVSDRWPGEGPLGGITSALLETRETSGATWNLVVSCDMPFLTREWLAYLIGRLPGAEAEVVVPESGHGLEPLCACWRTSGADRLQQALYEGVRKVTEAMKRLRVEVLDETHWKRFDTAGRLFWNMNTHQDYEQALRVWGSAL